MTPNILYYQNKKYVHISVLSQILDDIDLKKFWKNFKIDSKLQIVIEKTLGIQKPNYIIQISRCKIIQEYYENIQHYIRLNCLSTDKINLIQNL